MKQITMVCQIHLPQLTRRLVNNNAPEVEQQPESLTSGCRLCDIILHNLVMTLYANSTRSHTPCQAKFLLPLVARLLLPLPQASVSPFHLMYRLEEGESLKTEFRSRYQSVGSGGEARSGNKFVIVQILR